MIAGRLISFILWWLWSGDHLLPLKNLKTHHRDLKPGLEREHNKLIETSTTETPQMNEDDIYTRLHYTNYCI